MSDLRLLDLRSGGPQVVVREGVGHAYPGWEADTTLIADWFDTHLGRGR